MKPEIIVAYFNKYLGEINGITAETKSIILRAAQKKAATRELDGDDADIARQSLHFQTIRAEIIEERWAELPDEEKLYMCFPAAPQVGDIVDIPKRGKGTVLWRKLTKSLGLEVCFRMADETLFKWEYFD